MTAGKQGLNKMGRSEVKEIILLGTKRRLIQL